MTRDDESHRELRCLAQQQPDRTAHVLNFAKTVANPMNRRDPLSHNFPRAHHTQRRCTSITFAAWGKGSGKLGCGPESNGEKLTVRKLHPPSPHVETAQHARVSVLDHFQYNTASGISQPCELWRITHDERIASASKFHATELCLTLGNVCRTRRSGAHASASRIVAFNYVAADARTRITRVS